MDVDDDFIESNLRAAIDAQQFRLVYQPIVSCETGQAYCFEALARWRHPRVGEIPPTQFIRVAERCGLIDELSDIVFGIAMRWLADLYLKLPESLSKPSLALNVSALSLLDRGLPGRLDELCRAHGLMPANITLEMTETAGVDDAAAVAETLTALRKIGFRLSLDDFGTGYSSLAQLSQLPFSDIKIDRTFVAAGGRCLISREIIRFTVELAHNLGMKTIAEGVDNREMFRYLRQIGCDQAQGFLIAMPMDSASAMQWTLPRPRGLREYSEVR